MTLIQQGEQTSSCLFSRDLFALKASCPRGMEYNVSGGGFFFHLGYLGFIMGDYNSGQKEVGNVFH